MEKKFNIKKVPTVIYYEKGKKIEESNSPQKFTEFMEKAQKFHNLWGGNFTSLDGNSNN